MVEDVADLSLDEIPLLFDDDDLVQTLRELAHHVGIQRIGHADLQHPHPKLVQGGVIEAKVQQRLAEIGVGLAGGGQPEAIAAAANGDPVQLVCPGVGVGGRKALFEEMTLHLDRTGREEKEGVWFTEVTQVRDHDLWCGGTDIDRRTAVAEVGDALQRCPEAGQARERDTVQAELQQLRDGCGGEDRHAAGYEVPLGGVGQGRTLGLWIVGRECQQCRVTRTATEIGVLEDVQAAVDTRALAVPDAGNAVVVGGEDLGHLAAPHCGGGQLLVQPRPEVNVEWFQVLAGAGQLQVVAAQWRAGIAADHDAGPKTRRTISLSLDQGQADQRLDARHERAARGKRVLVLQGDRHLADSS